MKNDKNNTKICCPTELSAAVFAVANVLTEKLDSDDLSLCGAFFAALGDTLSMNALIVERCQSKTSNGTKTEQAVKN